MTETDFSAALSNSLSLSAILILTALGLAITFGVMRVINMAHGEILMLGAYTAFLVEDPRALPIVVQNFGELLNNVASVFGVNPGFEFRTEVGLHLNLFFAIPIAFLVTAAVGYFLEVGLIRFLYGRPLDTLLATWGVGMILQQVVLLLFGSNLQPVHTPEVLQGGITIAGVTVSTYRIFIVAVTGVCLLVVYWLFFKTSFGLQVRAVVQNRQMAAAMGISSRRVDAFTFAFASGVAGIAGCILAHLYNVKYTMGADYIVDAFMVVITGGMGQLGGSVASGALIGTGNSVVDQAIGNTPLAKFLTLLAVVGLIFVRPSGLFATKERSYE